MGSRTRLRARPRPDRAPGPCRPALASGSTPEWRGSRRHPAAVRLDDRQGDRAWGQDRAEARARLSRAIRQTSTVIQGGTTSKAFLLDLLDRPEFVPRRDRYDLLDTMMGRGLRAAAAGRTWPCWPPRFEAYEAHERRQQDRAVHLGRARAPRGRHETRHQVDVPGGRRGLQARGCPGAARSGTRSGSTIVLFKVDVAGPDRFELRLAVGGQTFDVLSVAQGPDYLVEVDGAGAPDLRRRGRPGPRPRPGHGGGRLGRGRGRGRRGRRGGRGGEHEAGDLAARPGLRPGRRGLRRRHTQVESGAKLLRIEPAADEGAEAESAREDAQGSGPTWARSTGRPRPTRIRRRRQRTRWWRCGT